MLGLSPIQHILGIIGDHFELEKRIKQIKIFLMKGDRVPGILRRADSDYNGARLFHPLLGAREDRMQWEFVPNRTNNRLVGSVL